MSSSAKLSGCPLCGLVQRLPETGRREVASCCRCGKALSQMSGVSPWTTPLALTGLAFYLPSMTLPMLSIEKLGHLKEDSLFTGVVTLLSEGYWVVGIIVLLFSVILPPLKLMSLIILSSTGIVQHSHHKAHLYHAVEILGKWGMLDVMLVAVLVAYVKLGDLVSIEAGSGVIAFAVMVFTSLIAGLSFNPKHMWNETDV